MATSTSPPSLGIHPDTLYRKRDLQRAANLGEWALRSLRTKHGLRVRRVGGRSYILGRDFIDAICRASDSDGAGEGSA